MGSGFPFNLTQTETTQSDFPDGLHHGDPHGTCATALLHGCRGCIGHSQHVLSRILLPILLSRHQACEKNNTQTDCILIFLKLTGRANGDNDL